MIEMLVCIAVTLVIAALLVPQYAKMRQEARKTRCLGHLKQLGIAMNLYVQDEQGYFPFWDGGPSVTPEGHVDVRELPRALNYFLGQENTNALDSAELEVVTCSSNTLDTTSTGARTYYGCSGACSDLVDYSINPNLWSQLLVDKVSNDNIAVILYDFGVDQNEFVHNGGANFLFVDGHVQWLKSSQTNAGWPGVPDHGGNDYTDWGLY